MLALLHIPVLFAVLGAQSTTVGEKRHAAPAHPTPPACSAVTRADVQFALGRSVGQPRSTPLPDGSTCDFFGDGGMVTVTVKRVRTAVDLQAEAAELTKMAPGSAIREFEDSGKRGLYLQIPDAGAQLYFITEDCVVMVSILGFGEAGTVYIAARDLASKALGLTELRPGGAR